MIEIVQIALSYYLNKPIAKRHIVDGMILRALHKLTPPSMQDS